MVERQLPKLDVAGSIPVARSIFLSKIAKSDRLASQERDRPAKRPANRFQNDYFCRVLARPLH